MKIGFDGKRAVQNYTGLGNYSRFIIDILSRSEDNKNEFLLYAPKPKANDELKKLLQRPNVSIKFPTQSIDKQFPSLWRTWNMAHEFRADGLSIFHGLSNELPLSVSKSGIKSVVTIHDLIFLRYPKFYPYIDRKIYAYKFRKACENSNHIIAISEATKRDIIHYFNIEESKISVIYQGCDASFKKPVSKEEKETVRRKYSLPNRFILNVGSIEERKNLLLIVKALLHLPDDIRLVAVGKHTAYTDEVKTFIHQHHLEKRIQIFHQIPFNELPSFYQLASLFIYPSRFEGFGIPIIEAIHSGLPVIAATGSCLEEAGGPSSAYVDPDDECALAKKINEIWYSESIAEQMKNESLQYVQRFSDENIASDLMNLYKHILKQ